MDQAKQLATDLVMGAYLEPMTQEIVQRLLDNDEEDNPHLKALQDPEGWWKDFSDIVPSRDATDMMKELWIDEPIRFQVLAERLFERRLNLGLELPNGPHHRDYQPIMEQIQQAVRRTKARDRAREQALNSR
ncbi:hypothetical protein [Corynebacterium sanguinis]|uniref:hypothetical protein n=1 Tax=Corynebacterium sanguinis TaxID=2594913 RepID=UPI0011A4AA11|nr:hypothetical protein [Corynebacterium sanguinis]MCT1584241.1 hypothetical protein [Corynebacterium sanguinis]MCT2022322.1 hypothetical protein [Corynebacterium sanguinis]MCT2153766.1 hypothetical protein [Corynebacterium sanguinis]TVS28324.1 hypothetical protein EKI56_00700 [Corynebacterium sanguinis]